MNDRWCGWFCLMLLSGSTLCKSLTKSVCLACVFFIPRSFYKQINESRDYSFVGESDLSASAGVSVRFLKIFLLNTCLFSR